MSNSLYSRKLWEHQVFSSLYESFDNHDYEIIQQLFKLWTFEFQKYSQNGEDGLLYHILKEIYINYGHPTKKPMIVEMCVGDGKECNSAFLVKHHGFHGIGFEGHNERSKIAKNVFGKDSMKIIHSWITKDNAFPLIEKYVLSKKDECDWEILVIDVDGMDYWILQAILSRLFSDETPTFFPKILLIEYQDILGPFDSKTVPYNENFCAWKHDVSDDGPNFAGASLMAFYELCKTYNYHFIGCESHGYNGFFIHESVLPKSIHIFSPSTWPIIFDYIPKVKRGMLKRYPRVQQYPWYDLSSTSQDPI